MPNLRDGEYMHTCESDFCELTTGGSRSGKPRPYIVRTYYSEPEKHYCSTCCEIMSASGRLVKLYDNSSWKGYEYA